MTTWYSPVQISAELGEGSVPTSNDLCGCQKKIQRIELLKKFLLQCSLFCLPFTLVPEASDTAYSYSFCGFSDVNYVLNFSITTLGFVFLRPAKSVATDSSAFQFPNLCCSCHLSVLPVSVAYYLLNQSINNF